jgi:hypothetical protein
MHNPRVVEGKYIQVFQLNDFFSHVTSMILEHFDVETRADNVFILGCYVLEDSQKIRARFPGKKLVVYQLEQMMGSRSGNWHNVWRLAENIRGYDEIWDYDPLNVHFLAERDIRVDRLQPMLYTESLNNFVSSENPGIDVLFYGIINERRWKILHDIQVRCYNDLRIAWLYGEKDMDKYMADSKVILNIHAFEPWNRQEQTRIFYPVINGKTVVSELSQHNQFQGLIVESDKGNLVDTLRMMCRTDAWKSFGNMASGEFKIRTKEFLEKNPF